MLLCRIETRHFKSGPTSIFGSTSCLRYIKGRFLSGIDRINAFKDTANTPGLHLTISILPTHQQLPGPSHHGCTSSNCSRRGGRRCRQGSFQRDEQPHRETIGALHASGYPQHHQHHPDSFTLRDWLRRVDEGFGATVPDWGKDGGWIHG
jgi:hypothetical protein